MMGRRDLPNYLPTFPVLQERVLSFSAQWYPFAALLSNISGQSAFDVPPQRAQYKQGGRDDCPVGELGVLDKSGEVSAVSIPGSTRTWVCGGILIDVTLAATGQTACLHSYV